MMKLKLILLFAFVGFHAIAQAGTPAKSCTTEPREKWQDQAEFEKHLKALKYTVRKFNVTEGNCYQLLGWDEKFRKVDVLFDPVSGKKVHEEVHK